MSQVEGLIEDLAVMARTGSSDQVLARCATLMGLRPVVMAKAAGVLGPVAVRVLLELVARQAHNSQVYVRAAAALTGIDPPDTGRGVRGDKGPQRRQVNAGAVLEGRGDRTMRQPHQRQRCYEEYTDAVLSFVRAVARDAARMQAYLRQCGVMSDDAVQLERPPSRAYELPAYIVGSSTVQDIGNMPSRLARLIPLSRPVGEALEAVRASCVARNRALYTPDILIALIGMASSRTQGCFEEVQTGLSRRIRVWLTQRVLSLDETNNHPFQPFDWIERRDVQAAQDLAATDNSPVVTEIHLLVAILDGGSNTRAELVSSLGPSFDRLRTAANARRISTADLVKTPGAGRDLRDQGSADAGRHDRSRNE